MLVLIGYSLLGWELRRIVHLISANAPRGYGALGEATDYGE